MTDTHQPEQDKPHPEPTTPQEQVGARIRHALASAQARGGPSSPARLQARANVSRARLQASMEGRPRGLRADEIVRVARALAVRVGWLVGDEGPMERLSFLSVTQTLELRQEDILAGDQLRLDDAAYGRPEIDGVYLVLLSKQDRLGLARLRAGSRRRVLARVFARLRARDV